MQTSPFKGPGIAFEMDEICGAHCGVEVRRPFADMDLWRFLLSLRAEVKFQDARVKGILRDSMRGLVPDPILDRTDKTYFDEYHLDKADYGTLKRFCIEPEHRMPGVDYDLLRDQIESGRMSIADLQWARDLARIHAFLRVC